MEVSREGLLAHYFGNLCVHFGGLLCAEDGG